jgi:hypothetical protein
MYAPTTIRAAVVAVLLLFADAYNVHQLHSFTVKALRSAAAAATAGSLIAASSPPALATDSKVVGDFTTSGLVFKDTLKVTSFEGKMGSSSIH